MSSYNSDHRFPGSHPLHVLNFYTAASGTGPKQMESHIRRGRRLQATAVRKGLLGVFKAAFHLARRAAAAYRRHREERDTERVLRSLSPATLQDIGIEGHQIPAIARGLGRDTGSRVQVQDPGAVSEPEPELEPCCLDRAA